MLFDVTPCSDNEVKDLEVGKELFNTAALFVTLLVVVDSVGAAEAELEINCDGGISIEFRGDC